MRTSGWVPAAAAILLCGCTRPQPPPDGALAIDETVTLERFGERPDIAVREIAVNSDSVMVAVVEENLTDVKLRMEVIGGGQAPPFPVEVENNLFGAGVEVAAIDVPPGARLRVTLSSAQDGATPGAVPLRVRQYVAKESKFPREMAALRAWSQATCAADRGDAVRKTDLDAIQRAIDGLDASHDEKPLAAQAQMVRAAMLSYYRIDWRAARAEALRAQASFGALPTPDVQGVARAKYLEALALFQMAGDTTAVNPTSSEAIGLAREKLGELSTAPGLEPIDRARALGALADVDRELGNTDDATRHFGEALAVYQRAGSRIGELETRWNLANVLLERGQFRDADLAFEPLLAEFERVPNVDKRIWMYIGTARARAFSGRGDDAPELLDKALALAREYQMRVREANALHGLGNVYQNRGDPQQAREYYDEAIRISRQEHDVPGLAAALELSGFMARADGDFALAMAQHEEGVKLASNPVARARALRALGMDYFFAGDYAKANELLRRALAEKLQDPQHHAYSDIKRDLAETLIKQANGSRAMLVEADTLVKAALRRSREVGDTRGIIAAYRVMGQLSAARSEPDAAQENFEKAFAIAHEYREKFASSEARAAPLRQEQWAFRDYLDIMLREVAKPGARIRIASSREEHALRVLENAREGNAGAPRTGTLDAETAALVDELLTRMGMKSLQIAGLLGRRLNDDENKSLHALQFEMASLYGELDQVRTAAAAKRASAENYTPDAARPWRQLRPGVVQLSYALGNDHVYAWSRSGSGIRVVALAQSPKDLENALIALSALDPQAAPAKIEQSLARISGLLLPEGLIPADSTGLEIAAEGRIASVAFAGLQSPANPALRLVETHSVDMVTSLFSVESAPRPTRARPFRLVALAGAIGGLRTTPEPDTGPRLQAAVQEIDGVAKQFKAQDPTAQVKLLSGAEGNSKSLRTLWGSGADVVHFATHARADLRQPLASLLVLPALDPRGRTTYVTAGQVESWRGDVELVFLSACDSAVGPPRFAVGLPGLQQAFLRAGARAVIATLWPIEDLQAQAFSMDFYKRYTSGESAAQALRNTQRAWLAARPGMSEADQVRRRITALAHGLYTQ